MTFEIQKNKLGYPYLKKVDRFKNFLTDGRGLWVSIGRLSDAGIERIVEANKNNGLSVLIDEDNVYRALVLTD